MSDTTDDHAYDRDAARQPVTAWVGMLLLFAGCSALTVAVVSLASDTYVSAVFGIVGAGLFIVGLVLVIARARLRGLT